MAQVSVEEQSLHFKATVFKGSVNMMFKNADTGGAIHATNTKLYITGNIIIVISNNTATDSGGGIYLYKSELKCMQGSNTERLGKKAAEKGGGLYAIILQLGQSSLLNIYTLMCLRTIVSDLVCVLI